jgi:hypothetical protein
MRGQTMPPSATSCAKRKKKIFLPVNLPQQIVPDKPVRNYLDCLLFPNSQTPWFVHGISNKISPQDNA